MYFYELSAHNRSIYCIIQIYVPYVCVCVCLLVLRVKSLWVKQWSCPLICPETVQKSRTWTVLHLADVRCRINYGQEPGASLGEGYPPIQCQILSLLTLNFSQLFCRLTVSGLQSVNTPFISFWGLGRECCQSIGDVVCASESAFNKAMSHRGARQESWLVI